MKPTDEQIIKALECCCDIIGNMCSECPKYLNDKDNDFCQEELHNEARKLINRQKAEIERWKAMVDAAEDYFKPLPFKNDYDEAIEKARAEAIKEFATFLKHLINRDLYHSGKNIVAKIDNLVKEMVGEENAKCKMHNAEL